jgi:hypothetical protein
VLRRLALTVLLLAPAARAAPILFPPLPDGRIEERDERDVAPFLAAWKAHQLRLLRQNTAAAEAAQVTTNQAAYDVRWYDLDLTFDPVAQLVSGSVRMTATVVAGPISTVDLDFYSNMTVDAVTSAGGASTFTRAGNVLTVNLDRAYANGELVDVRVTYHGLPVTGGTFGGAFGFTTANGRRLIWSLSEPYGARTWWPCKDAPEDKADSVTIRYTVPTGMKTASNGTLLQATDNGTVAVTRWRESHPIASYLVSIASYPYTQTTDWYRYSPTDSMRIDFFNYPESVAGVSAVQSLVKGMITAYAARMGQYPFVDEKYGHAQFNFGGGMEHQTCTSIGSFGEFVVAHELGHQWWGDLVTCNDFHHIWLNEGFATFMEACWAEAGGGLPAYHSEINLNRYYGAGSVYVPDATDESRIFDSNLSYNKGSWVLHMLRHAVGDTIFFQGMRQWGATRGYQSGTTEQFRDVFEAVSGRDLHPYFQQWIYGEYYPIYQPTWTSASDGAGGWDVTLTIEQTQSWQLFTMPIDVRVSTSAGDRAFVVRDSLASQVFTLHVDAAPSAVVLDPDEWILRKIDIPVSNPTFERSILLVNGVDWSSYGSEITTAYSDKEFSGDYVIDFWDSFATPAGGYPAPLPAPLGHGPVPPEVLGHYRNVVWVGNNFNGDIDSWVGTPILSYLRAGGNVLLMTRQGTLFLTDSLLDYAGIAFTNPSVNLNDCIATRPALVNVATLGVQSLNAVFDTVRTRADTQLLFGAQSGFNPNRGIGVIRMPAGGAGSRPNGGRLAFISGRPYRWNHTSLRANVVTILDQYFLEPMLPLGVEPPSPPSRALTLAAARPNPFAAGTLLPFTLGSRARVRAEVIDAAGRRVRLLAARTFEAGPNSLEWDGRDDAGRALPAGLYWARVDAAGASAVRRVVFLP